MRVFVTENTNTVMAQAYTYLFNEGVLERSRAGQVKRANEPVCITYTSPMCRVNFCEVRDANPFFHLAEALWMLAGRDDSAPMEWYLPNFKDFANNGHVNAAYGKRAFRTWGNQMAIAARELSMNHNTRQAVVQLWSPIDDLGAVANDKACNMSLVFQVTTRNNGVEWLDMTIMNRSNDAIWGGVSGANVVHMAFFLEYMSALVGFPPGHIHAFSNNLHMYTDNPKFEPLMMKYCNQYHLDDDPYRLNGIKRMSLFSGNSTIGEFNLQLNRYWKDEPCRGPFFTDVAEPMRRAYGAYKDGNIDRALVTVSAEMPDDNDWAIAAYNWLERRNG